MRVQVHKDRSDNRSRLLLSALDYRFAFVFRTSLTHGYTAAYTKVRLKGNSVASDTVKRLEGHLGSCSASRVHVRRRPSSRLQLRTFRPHPQVSHPEIVSQLLDGNLAYYRNEAYFCNHVRRAKRALIFGITATFGKYKKTSSI